ncbi:ArsR/SmtB family transcription factor [Microtetraspora malaysiensis]|uniref:ArsR/SmtB family transcription factor n=1 Tax=Microtetraspora malaysiensis TaxID=161358 RepID=A0ABW6SM07_9ACTN|nr:metalloregulator ArsR/SmtB family transcription factor [Microtetraspora malaysiensis]
MVAQVPKGSPVVPVEAIVEVLKAIADPTRFQILYAVSSQERGVGELAEIVGAHVASVSQHLAKLRAAGLVSSRRDGTRIFYRAANQHVAGLMAEAGLLTGYVTGVIEPPDDGPAPPREAAAGVGWQLLPGRLRPASS